MTGGMRHPEAGAFGIIEEPRRELSCTNMNIIIIKNMNILMMDMNFMNMSMRTLMNMIIMNGNILMNTNMFLTAMNMNIITIMRTAAAAATIMGRGMRRPGRIRIL